MRKPRQLKRIFGLFLSVVYGTTQVVLGSALESNFWAERRAVTSRSKKSPENALQFASLPAGASSLPHTSPLLSAPASSFSAIKLSDKFKTTFPPRGVSLLNSLPSSWGSVKKINAGGKKTDKIILHIQDVHSNSEAQAHISQTVRGLIEQKKIDLIALEGAFKPINLKAFREFPRPDVVREVADYLLQQNRISGPVHAALTFPRTQLPLVGVDDINHYQANVEAYKKSAPLIQTYKRHLNRLKRELAEAKTKTLRVALLNFDQQTELYREGKLTIGHYISFLMNVPTFQDEKKNQLQTETLKTFLQALHAEKSLDFSRVESERARLVSSLVEKLDQKETTDLIQASVAYRLGETNDAGFYRTLNDLCQKKGIRFDSFTAFNNYLKYVALTETIDGEKLFSELAAAEEAVLGSFAVSEEERDLLKESKRLFLTGKLLEFGLTAREWAEYKTISSFPRRRESSSNPSLKEILRLDSRTGTASTSRHNVYYRAGRLRGNDGLKSFEKFYEQAEKRDSVMAENLVQAMEKNGATIGVLVTGGFHSEGINKYLTKAGFTTITFVPKITKVESENGIGYLSVFAQEKTPLEKLFEGEKLFLAHAPMDYVEAIGGTMGLDGRADSVFVKATGLKSADVLTSAENIRTVMMVGNGATSRVRVALSPGKSLVRIDELGDEMEPVSFRPPAALITATQRLFGSFGTTLAYRYMVGPIVEGWGILAASPLLYVLKKLRVVSKRQFISIHKRIRTQIRQTEIKEPKYFVRLFVQYGPPAFVAIATLVLFLFEKLFSSVFDDVEQLFAGTVPLFLLLAGISSNREYQRISLLIWGGIKKGIKNYSLLIGYHGFPFLVGMSATLLHQYFDFHPNFIPIFVFLASVKTFSSFIKEHEGKSSYVAFAVGILESTALVLFFATFHWWYLLAFVSIHSLFNVFSDVIEAMKHYTFISFLLKELFSTSLFKSPRLFMHLSILSRSLEFLAKGRVDAQRKGGTIVLVHPQSKRELAISTTIVNKRPFVVIGNGAYRLGEKPIDLRQEWVGNQQLLRWANRTAPEMGRLNPVFATAETRTKLSPLIRFPLSGFNLPGSEDVEAAMAYFTHMKKPYAQLKGPQKLEFFHWLTILLSCQWNKDSTVPAPITDYRLQGTRLLIDTLKVEDEFRLLKEDLIHDAGLLVVRGKQRGKASLTTEVIQLIRDQIPYVIETANDTKRLRPDFIEFVRAGQMRPYFIVRYNSGGPLKNLQAFLESLEKLSENYNGHVTFIVQCGQNHNHSNHAEETIKSEYEVAKRIFGHGFFSDEFVAGLLVNPNAHDDLLPIIGSVWLRDDKTHHRISPWATGSSVYFLRENTTDNGPLEVQIAKADMPFVEELAQTALQRATSEITGPRNLDVEDKAREDIEARERIADFFQRGGQKVNVAFLSSGDKLRMAVLTDHGLARTTPLASNWTHGLKTEGQRWDVLRNMKELFLQEVETLGLKAHQIGLIGLSIGGPITRGPIDQEDRGIITNLPGFLWNDLTEEDRSRGGYPMAKVFGEMLESLGYGGIPIKMMNNADAALIGENRLKGNTDIELAFTDSQSKEIGHNVVAIRRPQGGHDFEYRTEIKLPYTPVDRDKNEFSSESVLAGPFVARRIIGFLLRRMENDPVAVATYLGLTPQQVVEIRENAIQFIKVDLGDGKHHFVFDSLKPDLVIQIYHAFYAKYALEPEGGLLHQFADRIAEEVGSFLKVAVLDRFPKGVEAGIIMGKGLGSGYRKLEDPDQPSRIILYGGFAETFLKPKDISGPDPFLDKVRKAAGLSEDETDRIERSFISWERDYAAFYPDSPIKIPPTIVRPDVPGMTDFPENQKALFRYALRILSKARKDHKDLKILIEKEGTFVSYYIQSIIDGRPTKIRLFRVSADVLELSAHIQINEKRGIRISVDPTHDKSQIFSPIYFYIDDNGEIRRSTRIQEVTANRPAATSGPAAAFPWLLTKDDIDELGRIDDAEVYWRAPLRETFFFWLLSQLGQRVLEGAVGDPIDVQMLLLWIALALALNFVLSVVFVFAHGRNVIRKDEFGDLHLYKATRADYLQLFRGSLIFNFTCGLVAVILPIRNFYDTSAVIDLFTVLGLALWFYWSFTQHQRWTTKSLKNGGPAAALFVARPKDSAPSSNPLILNQEPLSVAAIRDVLKNHRPVSYQGMIVEEAGLEPAYLDQLDSEPLDEATFADPALVRVLMLLTLQRLLAESHPPLSFIVQLRSLLNSNVVPAIRGSKIASDVLPAKSPRELLNILKGDGYLLREGKLIPAKKVFSSQIYPPLEGDDVFLRSVNPTLANAVVNLLRKKDLVVVADVSAALTREAVKAHSSPFHVDVQRTRPHDGQIESARLGRALVQGSTLIDSRPHETQQDAYSLRGIPQVHGAVREIIGHAEENLDRQLNAWGQGQNVNPAAVALTQDQLSFGATILAGIADRRAFRLNDERLSKGLPSNLVVEKPGFNSGMMIAQYTAASQVNAMANLSSPLTLLGSERGARVSVERTAEVCDRLENVLATELMMAAQGVDLRINPPAAVEPPQTPAKPVVLGRGTQRAFDAVRSRVLKLESDRNLSIDIAAIATLVHEGAFNILIPDQETTKSLSFKEATESKSVPGRVYLDGFHLTPEDVWAILDPKTAVEMDQNRLNILQGERAVALQVGGYGIKRGLANFGDVEIADSQDQLDMQPNILGSHAAGVGKPISIGMARAMMLIRMNTFLHGHSGVSRDVVKQLAAFLQAGISPVVPREGSVGASGDLAPLAHMGLPLIGLGEVWYQGKRMPAGEALTLAGIEPLKLGPKEALSIINGTTFSTAFAAINLIRMEQAVRQFKEKGNKLDRKAAALLSTVEEALPGLRQRIVVELNSTTDNPLVIGENVYSAGNFHGQPIALVLDTMNILWASMGEAVARTNPSTKSRRDAIRLKILAHPTSIHSIPTAAENQEDYVSMSARAAVKTEEMAIIVQRMLKRIDASRAAIAPSLIPGVSKTVKPVLAKLMGGNWTTRNYFWIGGLIEENALGFSTVPVAVLYFLVKSGLDIVLAVSIFAICFVIVRIVFSLFHPESERDGPITISVLAALGIFVFLFYVPISNGTLLGILIINSLAHVVGNKVSQLSAPKDERTARFLAGAVYDYTRGRRPKADADVNALINTLLPSPERDLENFAAPASVAFIMARRRERKRAEEFRSAFRAELNELTGGKQQAFSQDSVIFGTLVSLQNPRSSRSVMNDSDVRGRDGHIVIIKERAQLEPFVTRAMETSGKKFIFVVSASDWVDEIQTLFKRNGRGKSVDAEFKVISTLETSTEFDLSELEASLVTSLHSLSSVSVIAPENLMLLTKGLSESSLLKRAIFILLDNLAHTAVKMSGADLERSVTLAKYLGTNA